MLSFKTTPLLSSSLDIGRKLEDVRRWLIPDRPQWLHFPTATENPTSLVGRWKINTFLNRFISTGFVLSLLPPSAFLFAKNLFLSLIKGDCNDFGCEHLLEGNTYSMEGHLVHYNSKYKNFQEAVDKPDGLAVTGFFIHAAGSKDCEEFRKISDGIERVSKPNSKTRLASDCLSFLKHQDLDKHYFKYWFL